MENKVKLLIEIGLQRDEDNGDVSIVAFDVPIGVAERVCEEQDKCHLLSESGELTRLLNAYAVVNGYERAWFVRAKKLEELTPDNKYFTKEILIDAFASCGKKDCGSCPLYHFALENGEYNAANCLEIAAGLAKGLSDANDDLTTENAGLREDVLFWQGELEEMTKNRNAHELAGKLFEIKNTSLEKKLEKVTTERDTYIKKCEGMTYNIDYLLKRRKEGLNPTAAAQAAEAEMWRRLALSEQDKIRNAIRRMRDELKAARVHIDGVSLKAIPFETVDAVAERVMIEFTGGEK